MSMLTLRVLSRLMSYPEEQMQATLPEMRRVLQRESILPVEHTRAVEMFISSLEGRPVTELQEEYVALFDRGRALSLHMFEHVHGESRDRGQAMVDLLEVYRDGGLELDARELPDFLPLVLEFLSTRPREEADEMLGDGMAIIVLLGARLRQRGSGYAALFEALEAIVGSPENAELLREAASQEGPDQTIEKMDEIWEEEQVTFMGNNDPAGDCGAPSGDVSGLDIRRQTGPAASVAAGSKR